MPQIISRHSARALKKQENDNKEKIKDINIDNILSDKNKIIEKNIKEEIKDKK